MKFTKILIIAVVFSSLFASCKKDKVTPAVTLTPAMARDYLYDYMNDMYLWHNEMPVVNKADYADPFELMDAMRYEPIDRWSFVADYDEFMAEMQGSFVGHGFRIGLDDSDNARIVLIYDNSPLFAQGVRRGWIVKKINGTEVAPILKENNSDAYTSLIGPSEAGVTNIFLFQKPDGTETTITSTKLAFTLNSVLHYDTLHLSTGITGHLVFESFIEPSETELAEAFSYFSSNGAHDLILDLRYNSGGYLYIAQLLASYIAGNTYKGSDFIKLTYNELHPEKNRSFPFITTSYPLDLTKIVVITSRETASASECVMNGLKPYLAITSLGDTTNGKPTGMDGGDIGKKYFIAPVTFRTVNKNDEGNFYAGLAPNGLVSDDITHNFNDRNELCLKAAIGFLETGTISAKGSSQFSRHPQYSEKQHEWMKNTFVIDK